MARYEKKVPTDEEILSYDNVPCDVAAKYVKMAPVTIHTALRQERVPFGFAVENEKTGTWTYHISPGGLVKYKREGKPIIRLGDLREVMTDYIKDYTDAKMAGLSRVLEAVVKS